MRLLRRRVPTQLLVFTGLIAGAPACSRELPEPLARAALATYADIAVRSYGDACERLGPLSGAVQALITHPSDATLAAARAAWLSAREPYRQTEVFRFYGGPIDEVELLVNTWPIDENYVESAAGETPGIVDDVAHYPALSEALLTSLNGRDGETSISTGYHVVEFLLWGRDARLDGPGQRAAADFAPEELRGARRGQYLSLATALLRRHVCGVRDAWNGGYRARFLALPVRDALTLVLRGMGALSGPELRGERLTVAYETRDPENEHSCFSDSTDLDIVGNVQGIANVGAGRYGTVRGTGVCSVLDALAPDLGAALCGQVATSLAAARAIVPPFDRALGAPDESPERASLRAVMQALDAQTRTIERALAALREESGP